MSSNRIVGEVVRIREASVKRFFVDRAKRYDPARALTSVLYQDSSPDLALRRDVEEKRLILPMMALHPGDKVLDLGCGIGRWARAVAPSVAQYHGTDLMAEFVEIARTTHRDLPNATFQTLAAQDLNAASITITGPFSIILISGLLTYLNDADVKHLFVTLAELSGSACRIFVREPVGIAQRLTLDGIWSDELKCEYSAIYRTVAELEAMFSLLGDYRLAFSGRLYSSQLNHRRETVHHLFFLQLAERKST